jgi:hypothetical protein
MLGSSSSVLTDPALQEALSHLFRTTTTTTQAEPMLPVRSLSAVQGQLFFNDHRRIRDQHSIRLIRE